MAPTSGCERTVVMTTEKPLPLLLSARIRIEIAGVCALFAFMAAGVGYAFLYHAITHQKATWGPALGAASLIAALVGLVVATRPTPRWLAILSLVALPITVSILAIAFRLYRVLGD